MSAVSIEVEDHVFTESQLSYMPRHNVGRMGSFGRYEKNKEVTRRGE